MSYDRSCRMEIPRRAKSDPPDALVLVNVLAVGEAAVAFGKDHLMELGAAIQRDYAAAPAAAPR